MRFLVGANTTYIVWGAYHALLFLPLILLGRNRKYTNEVAEGKLLPSVKEICMMLATFVLVVIGWIFFRAETIGDAWHYMSLMFSSEIWKASYMFFVYPTNYAAWFVIIMMIVEWFQREKGHGLVIDCIKYGWLRAGIYYAIMAAMLLFFGKTGTFVYFQF